ncbi:3-dehydroquinate synthase [Metabacillus idriensis]|uniref:3-dehydroquinate synthase n=1 Tax=Metabacillus idriensis TaxID=324768 RepID=A0A6I2MGX9_9BACI|nr:3-dehydroquinate synthase [Metabacillus idriensis]MCM3596952.1 3-dehydroquinate synthase [Metabacillus idriensis]MRX55701.1 3-dehydroquinate synthase [Metabacillus idriensis]OHR74590.1 3-dehydroquinate synthase [Bacillus sp. HMSC76G11]
MKNLLIETASGSYPVSVGRNIIETELIKQVKVIKPSSILIIADAAVQSLYGERLLNAMSHSYKTEVFVVPSGEENKSFQSFYDIQTLALKLGLDRKSLILAFGGGVIGDLAGFAAATYMRGIPFIQLPTTLLAHDSAVGGKVAINHPEGKNMIGAFHQPRAVIYDLAFLSTLPVHELRSGFAEVIKHGLIGNADFYHWLTSEISVLDDLDDEKLQHMILEGIRVKAAVVKEDEKETGVRAHLNFGHTLGHAIEASEGYGKISHGDGVAIGMLFAIWLSGKIHSLSLPYEKIKNWFKELGFPVEVPENLSADALISRMLKDKKSHSGTITMVLLKTIGAPETSSFERDQLRSLLETWRQEGSV